MYHFVVRKEHLPFQGDKTDEHYHVLRQKRPSEKETLRIKRGDNEEGMVYRPRFQRSEVWLQLLVKQFLKIVGMIAL